MDTGKLNRRIKIQQQSATQDAAGQPIQSWSTVCSCWASIDIVRGQLIYNTAEFISKSTQMITIRFSRSQVFTIGQRIIYINAATGTVHTYEIQSILNPAEANIWIQFLCYELNGAE